MTTNSSDWEMRVERETSRVEDVLDEKFPEIRELLESDRERRFLRVLFRCPRGHALETVVLDADHNGRLMLRTLEEYESGGFATSVARTSTPFDHPQEDSLTMARVTLPCRRKNCRYSGAFTRPELLKLFTLARFVLNAPEFKMHT